jgi:hypothetical protein
LDTRVEVFPDLVYFLDAFRDLNRTRRRVLVPGGLLQEPIAEQAIESWLNIHCVSEPAKRSELYRLVRALDDCWLSHHERRAKKNAPSEALSGQETAPTGARSGFKR